MKNIGISFPVLFVFFSVLLMVNCRTTQVNVRDKQGYQREKGRDSSRDLEGQIRQLQSNTRQLQGEHSHVQRKNFVSSGKFLGTKSVDCHFIQKYIKKLTWLPFNQRDRRRLIRRSGLMIALIRNGLFAHQGHNFRSSLYRNFFTRELIYLPSRKKLPLLKVAEQNVYRLKELEEKLGFYSKRVREKIRVRCRRGPLRPPSKLKLIVRKAHDYLGRGYCLGGGQYDDRCFDCSGLTRYLFKQQGRLLAHSARKQARLGRFVRRYRWKKGDLLFFSNRRSRRIGHVGIYVGNDEFIHAENGRTGVKKTSVRDLWYSQHYITARRLEFPEARQP